MGMTWDSCPGCGTKKHLNGDPWQILSKINLVRDNDVDQLYLRNKFCEAKPKDGWKNNSEWQSTLGKSYCIECGKSLGGGFLWCRRGKNAKHHCRFCLFHVCNNCSTNWDRSKLLKINGERACKRCYAVAKWDPNNWDAYMSKAKYGNS